MLFSLYAQQTSSASYFPYMLIFSLVLCHRLKRGRETKTQKERERERGKDKEREKREMGRRKIFVKFLSLTAV